MRVLVLGGTNFLGKHAVRSLASHGYEVTSVNIDPDASSHLPEGAESIFCNRKDHETLRKVLSGRVFDAVVDIVHAPTLPPDIAIVLDSVGLSIQRYVYCSSSTVYQKNGIYPMRDSHPRKRLDEAPSPYVQAKLQNEDFLFERSRQGVPITIIRPRHIYGPDNLTYREGFHFDRLLRNRPILVPGDGSSLYQMGHVADIGDSFRLALETDQAIGQAYTITGDEAYTLDAYVDLLAEIAGAKANKVYFDPKLLDKFDQPGFVFGEAETLNEGHGLFDISKAKQQLGYAPRSLRDGMTETFDWYIETEGKNYPNRTLGFAFEDQVLALVTGGA